MEMPNVDCCVFNFGDHDVPTGASRAHAATDKGLTEPGLQSRMAELGYITKPSSNWQLAFNYNLKLRGYYSK